MYKMMRWMNYGVGMDGSSLFVPGIHETKPSFYVGCSLSLINGTPFFFYFYFFHGPECPMHMDSGEIVGPTSSYSIYLSMPIPLYYQYIASLFL